MDGQTRWTDGDRDILPVVREEEEVNRDGWK